MLEPQGECPPMLQCHDGRGRQKLPFRQRGFIGRAESSILVRLSVVGHAPDKDPSPRKWQARLNGM